MNSQLMLRRMLAWGLALAMPVPTGFAAPKTRSVNADYAFKKDVIVKAADRLVSQQNTDGGWNWYGVGSSDTNLYGVTALGLLDAYQSTGKQNYLKAAKLTADYLMNIPTPTDSASDVAHKFYALDIVFLSAFGLVYDSSAYTDKSAAVMDHFLTEPNRYNGSGGSTAQNIADYYHNKGGIFTPPSGISEWQLFLWTEAARATGNNAWAADMAAIIKADVLDPAYDSSLDTTKDKYYALGLGGALAATALAGVENSAILAKLVAEQNAEGSIKANVNDGVNQTTAYAAVGFAVSRDPHLAASVAYLVNSRSANGGWIESDGKEYTEGNSENIQAIFSQIYVADTYYYATIQDAINAASNGDTIVVAAGTYVEQLNINKNSLVISAVAGATPVILAPSDTFSGIRRLINIPASGVVFEGFEVVGNGNLAFTNSYLGIRIDGQNVKIRNSVVRDMLTGIQTSTVPGVGSNNISYNTISNVLVGISLQNDSNIVRNNNITAQSEGFGIASFNTQFESNIIHSGGADAKISYSADGIYTGSIQDGINAVGPGGTVEISTGTYNETLNLGGKTLTILGAGSSETIIDAHAFMGYAIQNFGNNSVVKNLKLIGTSKSTSSYGFKVSGTNGLTLENVVVDSSYKTGIDLNTVSNVTLNNVQITNTANGFGLMILNSHHVLVNGIATSGNAWGGISVQTSTSTGTDDVTFSGVFDVAENLPLLIEQDPSEGVYYSPTNVRTPGKFGYIVYDFREKENSSPPKIQNYKQWFYFESLASAKIFVQSMLGSTAYAYSGVKIFNIAANTFYVIGGMKIQDAIDSVSSGGTINVDAGMYSERITINKPLTLSGATYNVDKKGYAVPAGYAWDQTVESIITHPNPGGGYSSIVDIVDVDSVTFEGFVVQELGAIGNLNTSLIRVYAHTRAIGNIVIKNNIIGPNTNATSQDGKQGRMGLYIVNHPYSSQYGVVNSTFSGNKIFDCKGNGDNVFIWSSYHSYGAPGPASMSGTIIEDNEIYGAHRSGIETAGGYSGLIIRNNRIYGNSGLSGDDPANLLYGNGIVLVRGSSDRTSDGYGPSDLTIADNEIYNNEKNGIYTGPINRDYTITGNNIHDNGWDGIMLDLEGRYTNPLFEAGPGPYPSYDHSENVAAHSNKIEHNGQHGVRVNGAPANGFAVDAADNWWGTAVLSTIQSKTSASVTISPYYVNSPMTILSNVAPSSVRVDGSYTDGNAAGYIFGYDAFNSVREGVGAVAAGGTVTVAAGTYDGTVNVSKRVTVQGAGSGTGGTVLQSTVNPAVVATSPYTYRPVVIVNGSGTAGKPILFKDIMIRPRQDLVPDHLPAMLLSSGQSSYIELDNVRMIGTRSAGTNESGLTVGDSASVDHLTISNCEFKNMAYGMIFYKNLNNSTMVRNVNVSNTVLDSNSIKGFYAEKLSDAVFSNVTVASNGDTALSPSWADPNNSGIDVNLKFGSYEDLQFNNIIVTGNGTGSLNGAGLALKARGTGNDSSYAVNPALLTGVTISGAFSKNAAGLRFGEPGKNNTSPSNISVNNASISGNTQFGVFNALSGVTIGAAGDWWGAGSGPRSATNTAGLGDTISANVAYSPWWNGNYIGVTHPWSWSANSDLLTAIGTVSHGDTLNYLGSYSGDLKASKGVVVKFAMQPVLDSVVVDSGDLVLSSPVNISGNLNLTNGNVIASDTNKIVLDTSAANPVETSSGKIIGTVEALPRNVGTDSLHLLGLAIKSGKDDLGKVGVQRTSGNAGIVTVSDKPSIAMTWNIESDHQPEKGRDIVFSWLPDFDNNVDTTNVAVYRNDGSGWRLYAGPFTVSGVPRQIAVYTTGFSTWTLGIFVAPVIELSPKNIIFPSTMTGQWKDAVVTVENTGSDTLRITSIASTKSYFNPRPSTLTVQPGQTKNDTIRFMPDSIGTRTALILFTSNAVSSPDTVAVSGYGVGTPVLTLNKSSITLPSVKIGQWKDTTVAVTNNGNDTLKITSVASTKSYFNPRPSTLTVPPGQTKNDTIRFMPDSIGTRTALILFTSNDAASPDTVAVSGYGVGTPVLTFNKSSITFSSVKTGQWKDTTVAVTNTGNDTLKITGIASTKSFFSPRPTTLTIPPGQTKNDTIRFIPDSIGTRTALILFTSNEAISPDTVTVSGYGVGTPVLALSTSSVTFPSVMIGQWKDTTITITNTGNDTLEITSITSSSSVFSARPTTRSLPPTQFFTDTLRFAPTAIGTVSGQFLVYSNAITSPDTITVSGFGFGTGALQLSAGTINFGSTKIGQWKDTSITILNGGNDTLKITSITSTKDCFNPRPTALTIPPGQMKNDTIRFVPDSIGTRSAFILFASNAGTSPDTVTVSGYGIGTPVAVLNAQSVTFPSVMVGQWKDTTLTITNTGNDTLKMTSIASSNGVFSARPATMNLPPAQSFADTLRFAPTAIGTASGKLLVYSNADTGPDTITVSGFGFGTGALQLGVNAISFGSTKTGQWKDTSVIIGNGGNDTLRITSIASTHNYFIARPAALTIPPGQTKNDTIRFMPDSIGTRAALMLFVSNAGTSPDTIGVTGYGFGTPVLMLSMSNTTFPSTKIGQWKDSVIAVANTGNDTLKITGIASTRSYFSVRPAALTIPPGQTRNDTIRFMPDSIGTRTALLLFTSNDATGPDTVAVNGYGFGTPVLALNRSNIAFPSVKIGQWKDTMVAVTNTGNDTLKVTSIASTGSYFTARPAALIIPPGQMKNDTIRFMPDSIGVRSASVLFVSNDVSGPDTLIVTGYGTGTAALAISPRSITFSTVGVGQRRDTIVTITNSGNDTLKISNIASTKSYFSVHPTSFIIPPGGSGTDTVQFAPDSAGSREALILFTSNAATSPDTLAVGGNGTTTGVVSFGSEIPKEYVLFQNYPNPFNPSTTIRFGVPVRSHVRIDLYNILGQRIERLVDEDANAGYFEKVWYARIASGFYFYRIEAQALDDPNRQFVSTKKLLLLK